MASGPKSIVRTAALLAVVLAVMGTVGRLLAAESDTHAAAEHVQQLFSPDPQARLEALARMRERNQLDVVAPLIYALRYLRVEAPRVAVGLVDTSQADYLNDDEPVFGVTISGDVRAYPYRIMDWHEMCNDVVGGVPVSLAYCTLCGSAILHDTRVNGYGEPFLFGSSGFLYRSNKLMYDRGTHSL